MSARDDRALEALRAAADGPAGDLRAAVAMLSEAEARRLLVDVATAEAAWRAGVASPHDAPPVDTSPEAFVEALDAAARVGSALDAIADEGDLAGLVAAVLALAHGDLGLAVLEPRLRRMTGRAS